MILSSSNQTVLVSRFFDKEAKNVDRVIKAVEKEIELNYPDIVIDVIKDVLPCYTRLLIIASNRLDLPFLTPPDLGDLIRKINDEYKCR